MWHQEQGNFEKFRAAFEEKLQKSPTFKFFSYNKPTSQLATLSAKVFEAPELIEKLWLFLCMQKKIAPIDAGLYRAFLRLVMLCVLTVETPEKKAAFVDHILENQEDFLCQGEEQKNLFEYFYDLMSNEETDCFNFPIDLSKQDAEKEPNPQTGDLGSSKDTKKADNESTTVGEPAEKQVTKSIRDRPTVKLAVEKEVSCPVNKLRLNDQKTYFMYSQCHMSNLSTTFILSTLKNLTPDQETPEAKEALVRWPEESRCKYTVVVKGCEHVISNDKLCSHKQKTATCSPWEFPCVTCNTPSSIRLPIYNRRLVEILTAPAPVGNPFVLLDMMDIFNTGNPVLETLNYFNKMRFSQAQLEVILAEYENTKACITQMMTFISSFHNIEKNEAKIESGFPITSLSANRSFILSFIEVLQLVQVKGLAQCIQQFGKAYHSIYLMFILNAVVRYSSLTATSEEAAKLKEIEENRIKNKMEIEQCVIACKEVMISVNAMFHSEEVLRSKNICRLYTVLISHLVDRPHPASTLGPLARRCICLPCIY